MDKLYKHQDIENKWYKLWEENGYFTPQVNPDKKPFTIILPLPNANDPMHMGHALFTIQDIMVRYHRMKGYSTLWLPGGDHAGIETQFVYEKKLAKDGKSRFDFDRETLYKKISDFVDENRDINKNQMKRLGFSLDWTRYHYSLEPEIVERVFETFRKLHGDNLLYRAERIVNYCTFCGTAFSDLEVDHVEKDESLYYLDYGIIQIATTRPETIFADVAVAVNPKDKKYKKLIGKEAIIPIINKKIPIIADEAIEIGFGTGALKVTPAHDMTDFEIGVRHNLPVISVISLNGKMINVPSSLEGMFPKPAKVKTLEMLESAGKLVRTEPLHHTVGICYRCKHVIEPLPVPQWYVRTKPLAENAIKAVKKGETRIFPVRFKKLYFDWMENIRDWNISRQIVWGPRIPAWYCLSCNPKIIISYLDDESQLITGTYDEISNSAEFSFEKMTSGLQSIRAPIDASYSMKRECGKCKGDLLIQETDTFDTWFLSGQWPVNTLKDSEKDFKYFYPTSVLDTLWDILFFWVGRMMMLGIYLTGKVPFELIHLHARVVDKKGQKMSKSKGNVINPLEMADKYGADALRMALVYAVAPASDIHLDEDKVRAMRNFSNKLWNMARFYKYYDLKDSGIDQIQITDTEDKKIMKKLDRLVKSADKKIKTYYFGQAAEEIYQFAWHELADVYIEKIKERLKNKDGSAGAVFKYVFTKTLTLLHPFMPYVTEEINVILNPSSKPLIVSNWPEV